MTKINRELSHYIRHEFKEFGGEFHESKYERPTLSGEEVLIEMNFCGVCHSDVHIHEGYYGLGGDKKLSLSDRGIKLPVTLGHEIVGTVIEVSKKEDASLIGKQFLVYPWGGCGTCQDCLNDRENLCMQPASLGVFKPGGYSELVVIPSSRYLVNVSGLDPAHASMLACSGLTSFSAIKKIAPENKNGSFVIIGCGGLGQIAIKMLNAMGVKNVYAIDISSDKRSQAEKSGALKTFDPSSSDLIEEILSETNNSCGAVIDFVGTERTVETGLNLVRKGGQVVIVGLHGGEIRYPIPIIITKAISIIGSYTGSLGEMKELVKLARNKSFIDIPVELRELSCASKAINDLEQGMVEGRIILKNK